ncbi:hypothetical protein D9615_009943 [Tricholomella constricta]|uniref:Uncharacterized protein n=1 Tax=Tricholomella constricta TaxID=117010 RepID=A0A8H5GZG6_9AGAR|nr:hypothetical protein D9615_009943 [Tricholomella constricta]
MLANPLQPILLQRARFSPLDDALFISESLGKVLEGHAACGFAHSQHIYMGAISARLRSAEDGLWSQILEASLRISRGVFAWIHVSALSHRHELQVLPAICEVLDMHRRSFSSIFNTTVARQSVSTSIYLSTSLPFPSNMQGGLNFSPFTMDTSTTALLLVQSRYSLRSLCFNNNTTRQASQVVGNPSTPRAFWNLVPTEHSHNYQHRRRRYPTPPTPQTCWEFVDSKLALVLPPMHEFRHDGDREEEGRGRGPTITPTLTRAMVVVGCTRIRICRCSRTRARTRPRIIG